MSAWIANARMYAVTPGVESVWEELLAHIARDAEVPLVYAPYPAPQPLEHLWNRTDLGCVLMCGYPIARRLAPAVPIAAPCLSMAWAQGRAAYRSDLIVRADAPFRTLADTFGGRSGWTVRHSHSGFNAFRHHLLRYRSAERRALYATMQPALVTARAVLDAVRDGRLDVGPLDAYWHWLMATHAPEGVADIRVLESTDLAPIPAFVASSDLPSSALERLQAAFVAAHSRPWFSACAQPLGLLGFVAVGQSDFDVTLEWEQEAVEAGYPLPA
jgi:ABC-type phosphate/phosphonate transport system substrate-binding protein